MELKLTHKNSEISTLIPKSFDYKVIHYDKPLKDEDGFLCGYETDYYTNVDILNLWSVHKSSTLTDVVEYTTFHCKYQSQKQCKELIKTIKSMTGRYIIPKVNLVAEGKLTFIDKPVKMEILHMMDTVSEMIFTLHNCMPTYLDKDEHMIGIVSDFVEVYVSK